MDRHITLDITVPEGQKERLVQLQTMFAQACNHLSPLVQQTRCWNRVALHHMAYRDLRTRFPALGSQMACNVIYSVSRTCRALYQNRTSPYALHKLGNRPLPQVLFLPQSPVYFDRHTLSLREGRVSMYTLDGRIKFNLELSPGQDDLFRTHRLREIVMTREGARIALTFVLTADDQDTAPEPDLPAPELPQYLLVRDDEGPQPMPGPFASPDHPRPQA
jgi:hypothetical protein